MAKLKFTVESYLKCFPGEIEYYSFKEKELNLDISTHKLSLRRENYDIIIKVDKQNYKFVHSEKSTLEKTQNSYFMPWIENSKSLNHGAIILPLKS